MDSKTAARPTFAYVGCFTSAKRKARGQGIAVFRIDPASGAWSQVEAYDAIPNPGFIALDPSERFLYSAHGDSSEVGAYARDGKTGRLRLLNKQQTGGGEASTPLGGPRRRAVPFSHCARGARHPTNDPTLR